MDFLLQEDVPEEVSLPITTSNVSEFYTDRVVLITGGTGFLGKLLIEKLLRECSGVRKIYLLLRLKGYFHVEQRVEEMFNLPIFSRLLAQDPTARDKIEIIRGDCYRPDLGLGPRDQEQLCDEVELVFHCASTTMFDASLKAASDINVRALKDLIVMAKRMKKLKAFVHLSTIYTQCTRKVLDEDLAKAYISSKALMEFADSMDTRVTIHQPINLGKTPNYYIFSKCIAEEVIKSYGSSLPMVILRPGIAISTWKDPIPGWTDNVNGPSGLVLSIYLGLAKSIIAGKNNVANLVPADVVINAMLVAAWDVANLKVFNDNDELLQGKEVVPIYNVAGSQQLTWGMFFDLSSKYGQKLPTKFMLWRPWHFVHTNMTLHLMMIIIFHYIPACLLDYVTFHLYSKTKYLAYYTKIDTLINTLKYFTLNTWEVKDDNLKRLRRKLSTSDRRIFNFDVDRVDWEQYFNDYILGIRWHILKDGIDTLEVATWSYKKLALYTTAMICVYAYALYAILRKLFY